VRSQFQFNIQRGGAWSGKVRRYLRTAGLDNTVFVTDKMRQRHVHPRAKRHIAVPVAEALIGRPEGSPDREPGARTGSATLPTAAKTNPFAQLGKKPDAPAR